MKKVYALLLVVICLLTMSISGCGEQTVNKNESKLKIGVTVYDQYDTFMGQLVDCFLAFQSENVEIAVYNAAQSQQTQNAQVKKMIEDDMDIICVNLVDRTDPTAVIDAARKNDVPVIFFNRELVEGDMGRWDKLFYVGADAEQSGVMEGELAAWACITQKEDIDKNGDGVIQYVVLEGEAGHQDAIIRTEASVNTLKKQGVEIDKLGYAIANWNRAQAQTKAAQFIEDYGDDIELVLSNNDDMALGAIDAYEAKAVPRNKWPAIFGIDGTNVGLEAVRDDKMLGTVYNDKEGQASAMFELASVLARGGSIDELSDRYTVENGRYIRLPYEKVTSSNIIKYLSR
ncbi:galactose ABC transporter substrate-binding protein [Butyrivibrio sp. XPD2006]|uniref:galactose ABC transporter substrate-binding protein n=1 Tax=Butyrivibrio sp. XPD2006 TaxID=1280668 RepID=UPI000422F058|nr:galactose ABC transporter substrate-binding protein [Butyrivibrio sp. XPD2006]